MASNRLSTRVASRRAFETPRVRRACARDALRDTRLARRRPTPGGSDEHSIKLFAALAAGAVLASIVAGLAFGSDAKSTGTIVKVAKSPLGRILVDSKGITLYDFRQGQGHDERLLRRVCRPLAAADHHGKPIAGPGVRASLLGTTKRRDGKLEVTYGGHPLYYFVTDRKPGQTTGQGVNQFGGPWWVISPAGKEIHHV